MDAAERELMQAHARGDGRAVALAYLDAADLAARSGDEGRAAFFLTHAWVFALEAGDPLAGDCHLRLVRMGRA